MSIIGEIRALRRINPCPINRGISRIIMTESAFVDLCHYYHSMKSKPQIDISGARKCGECSTPNRITKGWKITPSPGITFKPEDYFFTRPVTRKFSPIDEFAKYEIGKHFAAVEGGDHDTASA